LWLDGFQYRQLNCANQYVKVNKGEFLIGFFFEAGQAATYFIALGGEKQACY